MWGCVDAVSRDPLLLVSGREAGQAAAAGPAVWNQWQQSEKRVTIFLSHMCRSLIQLSPLVLCPHSCHRGTPPPHVAGMQTEVEY